MVTNTGIFLINSILFEILKLRLNDLRIINEIDPMDFDTFFHKTMFNFNEFAF